MDDGLFTRIENFLNSRQEEKQDYTMDAHIMITLSYRGIPIKTIESHLTDKVDIENVESIREFVSRLFKP